MKGMIAKFFLGRGIGKVSEVLSKTVRHALTTWGGWLMANGHITADDMAIVQGGAIAAVGALLSVIRTYISARMEARDTKTLATKSVKG
jgi:hypothetical protein